MNWESKTLGEISLSIQTGPFGSQLHQSDYSDDGTPVVMPKDLMNGTISEESIARVSKEHVERLEKHKIQEGDILYSRRGDVGRCAFTSEREKGWLCGTGCLKVRIDKEKAEPKFVFYQLQKAETIGWVVNHAVGSTMLNLNTSILSAVPVDVPEIEIQRKIVSILIAYDELIENNRKQIKLLEEAAQRLYKEWFVDLRFPGYEDVEIVDGVPEGWKEEKLIDIANVQYGFAFDSSLFNSQGKGKQIIRIRNIPSGITDDYTTQEADEQYIVSNGDIVVGMDGEFHINSWCGKTAYEAIAAIYAELQKKRKHVNTTNLMIEINSIISSYIEIQHMPITSNQETRRFDISAIDFGLLRTEFAKVKRKNLVMRDLEEIIQQKLDRMLFTNPERINYYERYQQIIMGYNAEQDRATIEKTFMDLMDLANQMNQEEQRYAREGFSSDEELSLYDMLFRDDLSKNDIKKLKEVATTLLRKIKNRIAEIDHWTDKQETKAEIDNLIRNILYDELPLCYDEISISTYRQRIYEYVYTRYKSVA